MGDQKSIYTKRKYLKCAHANPFLTSITVRFELEHIFCFDIWLKV